MRTVLDVTLFLASRGLPLQGDNTDIGDVNNDNFVRILELLGRYGGITTE
jgi:hypothetical protein